MLHVEYFCSIKASFCISKISWRSYDCHKAEVNLAAFSFVDITRFKIVVCLYRQTKHKDSKLVHTAKCLFYTKIALASFSKELHQIVDTLSNRHPPKIFPTIYPSADLPSLFIRHFNNKVEKVRALEPVNLNLNTCFWDNYCNFFFI